MTTHDENIPGDGESVTEEQRSEPDERPQTPSEAKATVPGGSALVRSDKHVSDTEMEVLGTSTPDENEPKVSVTVEADGLSKTAVSLGLSPEQARSLAAELCEQATHAEQWAIYKREHEPDA